MGDSFFSFLNPTIYGKKLFPSSQVFGDFGRSMVSAFTPSPQAPPATMAGVSIPPAGASFGQLAFRGPLLGTGPMFATRGAQQPAPQPVQQPYNYGPYLATMGLPSFDVTKTQTPSSQSQVTAGVLTESKPLQFSPATSSNIPVKPEEPRMATSTKYGTIYATPRQLENLNASDTAYVTRSPEEQRKALALVRENGRAMAPSQQKKETRKDSIAGIRKEARRIAAAKAEEKKKNNKA